MHPTARKCVRWATGLFVVGAVLIVFGPHLFAAIAGRVPNEGAVLGAVDVTVTLVRWTLMPLGASLVGAAVVIQTLAPRTRTELRGEAGPTPSTGNDQGDVRGFPPFGAADLWSQGDSNP